MNAVGSIRPGSLPPDWRTAPLDSLLETRPNYGIGAAAVPFDPRFPTYLRITDISEDGQFLNHAKTSVDHPMAGNYLLKEGDIVFARTGASVGKSYLYQSKDGELAFAGFLIRVRPDNKKVSSAYLRYFVQTSAYWSWIAIHSMRSGQPGINGRQYGALPIPLPPTKAEQEAIAQALGDADALIDSLEQILAKKRLIKQGAMQQLLTGKKRLPGFSGEWEAATLSKICQINIGRTPSRSIQSFWGSGYKWLSIADLKAKVISESKEEITPLAASSMQVIRKGTLLMSFKLSLGRLCFAGCDLFTNEAICSFTSLKADADFLYYALGRVDFSLYGKQAVKGYTLNSESLNSIEIRLPCEREQAAIAAVLSDMDEEASDLEEKLAKARTLKQGMMQQLLTGRTRLV